VLYVCISFCVYSIVCAYVYAVFVVFLSFAASPSVLWYCWLGLLTCKNRLPYNLYCVGGDVKHCTIQSNPSHWLVHRPSVVSIWAILWYWCCRWVWSCTVDGRQSWLWRATAVQRRRQIRASISAGQVDTYLYLSEMGNCNLRSIQLELQWVILYNYNYPFNKPIIYNCN